MQPIPGNDALFLALDTPLSRAQIGGIAILDASGAEGFGFGQFKRILAERIREAAEAVPGAVAELTQAMDRP